MQRWLAYVASARTHLWDEARIACELGSSDGCAGSAPVVFVHGFLARKSCWLPMLQRLAAADVGCMRMATYSIFEHGLLEAAARVADKVERVCDEHGVDRVRVVAHSMGGIATLAACADLGLADRLEHVVTLGSPYGGAPLAQIAAGPLRLLQPARTARQLAPRSLLLERVRGHAAELTVPWTVLYSHRDELVPVDRARLDGPTVYHGRLPDVGHVQMLHSGRVATQVAGRLCRAPSSSPTALQRRSVAQAHAYA